MKHFTPLAAVVAATALLVACSSPDVVYRDRIQRVPQPIPVGCVVDRPQQPAPLWPRITPEMDHKQREATNYEWALEWAQYGMRLSAATGGCPDADEVEMEEGG